MNNYERSRVIEYKGIHPGIVFLLSKYPGFGYTSGGTERHFELLVNNLPPHYQSHVFVSHEPDGISDHAIMDQSNLNNRVHIYGSNDPESLLDTLKKIQGNFGIIYIGSISFLRNPDLFHRNAKALKGIPLVLRATSEKKVSEMLEQPSLWESQLRLITQFISQSPRLTELVTRLLAKVNISPEGKIVQIKNAVDSNRFFPVDLTERMRIKKEVFQVENPAATVFVYTGRIANTLKCVDTLIDTWHETGLYEDGHTLLLIGDYIRSEYGNNLFSNHHGKNNIVFTGSLSHPDLITMLQGSDVFVNPSKNEGLSNSILEAMACELPVIARDGVSGNDMMVIQNQTGFRFTSDQELHQQMIRFAKDSDLRLNLGKNARRLVENDFGVDSMIYQYQDVFRSSIIV